jgi:hypothetical protein
MLDIHMTKTFCSDVKTHDDANQIMNDTNTLSSSLNKLWITIRLISLAKVDPTYNIIDDINKRKYSPPERLVIASKNPLQNTFLL